MSASLVGSEMCIRDRCRSIAVVSPAKADDTASGERPTATARSPKWSATVSYTHLTLPTICSV
eukprot:10449111-Alexandrium_andersonii.AAC.1